MESTGDTITQAYGSIIETANFLAEQGDHELALHLTQKALEDLYLRKEKEEDSPDESDESKALELQLTQKYLEFRARIDDGRAHRKSYIKTLINACIICLVASLGIIMTAVIVDRAVVRPRVNGLVSSTVRPLTDEVIRQVPKITKSLDDAIQKVSKDLVDRKLIKVIEKKTEEVVVENLPRVVEQTYEKRHPQGTERKK